MTLAATSTVHGRPLSEQAALAVFGLLFASSSIVHFEPAPFDLAFIALFGISMVLGLRIPNSIFPLLALMAVFLVFGAIGATLGSRFDDSVRHIGITGLLCAVSVFIACFIYRYRERALRALLLGWLCAALIASVLGILGYFNLLGGLSEQFTLYWRAKGTFKDPNVLAPYIIVPILFCAYELLTRRGLLVLIHLGCLAVLMLALLLTFSRGGWAHFIFSASLAGTLWIAASRDNAFKARLILFLAVGAAAAAIAFVLLLDVDSIGTLFEIRAQVSQDYDSGASGRFAGQLLTIKKILENPLGLGALGFLPEWYEQPHNVYLFVFMTSGWFGGIAYMILIISVLVLGFRALASAGRSGGLLIILIASFLGVVLEGAIVDTDHWRHFWMLVGAIIGVYAMVQSQARQDTLDAQTEAPAPPQPALRGSFD